MDAWQTMEAADGTGLWEDDCLVGLSVTFISAA